MRVRKKAWAANEVETSELIIKAVENHKGKWNLMFSNENAIHLEIGCGKGRFVCEAAKVNPEVNFVAMEREPKVIAMASKMAREQEIKNIRFICADAKQLTEFFEEHELLRIYINFPDPWPNKSKWAKKRLTYRNFLDVYKILLKENGEIHFKTDSQNLFEFSVGEFEERGFIIEKLTVDLHNSPYNDGNIKTEYEEKFSSMGMPIHRLEAHLLKLSSD